MNDLKNVLVIGGGHGIGKAIVDNLANSSKYKIFATFRDKSKNLLSVRENLIVRQLDPLVESDLDKYFADFDQISFDLVVNCVGVLGGIDGTPEKSVKDLSLAKMTETFRVNTFLTPILGKRLKRRLNPNATFATLSAMVGSISDNKLGGWYSYRGSKAALNMFIKTLSIEFSRLNKGIKLVAVHPGTTETELSKNYLGGIRHKVWSPEGSAENILKVLFSNKESGVFLNWDGEHIPW